MQNLRAMGLASSSFCCECDGYVCLCCALSICRATSCSQRPDSCERPSLHQGGCTARRYVQHHLSNSTCSDTSGHFASVCHYATGHGCSEYLCCCRNTTSSTLSIPLLLLRLHNLRCRQGSLLYKDVIAQHDDALVQRLQEKGAIIVGASQAAAAVAAACCVAVVPGSGTRSTRATLLAPVQLSLLSLTDRVSEKSSLTSMLLYCVLALQARPTPQRWVLAHRPTTSCSAQP
jgi:hypothetical protein